jgi:(p)ppGpp synthase/HD superfamily hydrolase
MKTTVPISRKKLLFNFSELHHRGQVRKYTGEPYINHAVAVGKLADTKVKLGYEVGICHDLLEDTNCTIIMLTDGLKKAGYNDKETQTIVKAVVELTEVYTHVSYPDLNRKNRKILEAERLWKVSALAQTVKYADFLDNGSSIFEHDKHFAKVYLEECSHIMSGLNKGDAELRREVVGMLLGYVSKKIKSLEI